MKELKFKMLRVCDQFIRLFGELRMEIAAIPEDDTGKLAKVFHYKFQDSGAAVDFTEVTLLINMIEEDKNGENT